MDDGIALSSPAGFVPALAVAVALATGMLELPAALLRRDLFLVPIEGDGHVLWMAALANLVLVFPVAALLWGINRLRPGRRTERAATLVLFTLAAYALLLYIPRVNAWGVLFIAVGMGVSGSAIAMRRREAFHRGVTRLAWWLPLILLIYAGLVFAWTPLRERWMNRGLPAVAERRPNVLLLVLDTVRAMRLSLYGYDRATTPALERWAQSGTVFEQAIATASWTTPSHAGMFTGHYPHELNTGFRTPLDDRWPTLAEVLAQEGYRTAGFSSNRKYASYESGLARGFARFEDFRVSPGQVMVSSSLARLLVWQPWFTHLIRYYDLYGRKNAAAVSDEFLRWVGHGTQGRPFFAFLNYYDAHDPYLAPPAFDRRFTSDTAPFRPLVIGPSLTPKQMARELEAHEGAIAYIDHEIDRLLRDLESRGLLENTLVILTGDHGEQFGEHELMDHGNSLYRSLLDVPLFLRLPGRVPERLRITTPVTLRDLPATVLDLTGGPAKGTFPGSSWASAWGVGERTGSTSPLLSELTWPDGEIAYALRVGDHEYIDWFQQREELYDLRNDPAEARNLARKDNGAITAPYRAFRDSVVGDIHRPPEVERLQGWLTGIIHR
jgi:arylsulfatase A-like enzyme